jgi:pyrroline-5-carboxylate reductase
VETLGIIGAGRLASFLVAGLRHAGDGRRIVLSPRSAATAAHLAARYGCDVADGNQAVVDAGGATVIAVPPQHAVATIAALAWPAGHLVVCTAIGVDLATLRAAAPDTAVVRAMPTAASAVGLGSTPIVPDDARAAALFATVGDVHSCPDETAFAVASALSVYHLWLFGLMDEMAAAAADAGLPHGEAVRLVAGLTRSAGALALDQDPALPMRAPLDLNGTPGTMTAQGLAVLEARGAFAAFTAALASAMGRVGGR